MTPDPRDTAGTEQETAVPDGDLAGLWRRWCAGDESVEELLLGRAPDLSSDQLVQLLIVEQQRRWRQGNRVSAEVFFQRYPWLKSDPGSAVDLVYAEFLLEAEVIGPPDVSRYLERFPEFRAELQRQFDVEGRLGKRASVDTLDVAVAPGLTAQQRAGVQSSQLLTEAGPLGTFGDYELLSVIATGGMGVVYKARQRRLNRLVALKMIRSAEFAAPEQVERFYTEARAAANLQHPHIVAIHEVGEQGGQHFYSMDFIEGETLAEMVSEHALPPQRAAAYLKTIAETMQYAHDHGVLHRDLKPANVLIDQVDQPRIADFGLAKQLDDQSDLTIEGAVMGTPSYMPPEQAAGHVRDVGPASDVYSIGAILYELLTGRPPFRGTTRFDTIQQVLQVEPVSPRLLNPSVPRDLDTICLKCLHKDPARRYATARELADDVSRFLADRPILARPAGVLERSWRWCHRNPSLASAVGLAALSLIAAMVSLSWSHLATKAALSTAESALTTAERRLDQTRRAIDELFTLVAEETLLNKPGLQQLRKDLLLKARDLYRDVLEEEGDHPEIRHDLSVSHFRYGRIMEELGSPKEALKPLHRARSMQESLLSDQPQDATLRCDLSDTWNALGTVLSALRNYEDAQPYFQRALDARQTLAEHDPGNREYRRKLANILMNLGVVCRETGQLAVARRRMQAAQELRERLLADEPDSESVRRDLAKGYFNLARVEIALRDQAMKQDDIRAFEESYFRTLELFDRVIDEFKKLPPDSPWALSDQYFLATCYHLKGRETWGPEQTAEAEMLFDEARRRMQSLADANPDVHLYQGTLASIYLDLGAAYAGQEEDKSHAMFEMAREILAPLVEQYPGVTDYRVNLMTAQWKIASVRYAGGRLDEATRVVCQSAEHAGQLQARFPDRPTYGQMLAESLQLMAQVAEAYLERGEHQKANDCLEQGLRLDPENKQLRELRDRVADSDP